MRDDLDHLLDVSYLKSKTCHSIPSPVTSSIVWKLFFKKRRDMRWLWQWQTCCLYCDVCSIASWIQLVQLDWWNIGEGGGGPGRHTRMEDKGVTNFVQTTSNIFSLFFNSNKLSFRMNDKTRVGFLLEDKKIMAETAREKLLRRRIFFNKCWF